MYGDINKMIKILFICHGNICRSPMAEFVFKDLVKKEGLEEHFYIQSGATSAEEIGNSIYPPVYKILQSLNIDCKDKKAQRVTQEDIDRYDYLIIMDENNQRNLYRYFDIHEPKKVHKLLEFSNDFSYEDISDPWYSGEFNKTYKEVLSGCKGLLTKIRELNNL